MTNEEIAKRINEITKFSVVSPQVAEILGRLSEEIFPGPKPIVGNLYSTSSDGAPAVWDGTNFVFFDKSKVSWVKVEEELKHFSPTSEVAILRRFENMTTKKKAELIREWAKYVLATGNAEDK